jgi:hypothetical protein
MLFIVKTYGIHGYSLYLIVNTYSFMIHKPEGKRPLGKSIGRQVDNIKMNQRE